MESCHEYLGCQNSECVMKLAGNSRPCWQVEDTMCNHPGIEIIRRTTAGSKEEACARSGCIYYKHAKSIEKL